MKGASKIRCGEVRIFLARSKIWNRCIYGLCYINPDTASSLRLRSPHFLSLRPSLGRYVRLVCSDVQDSILEYPRWRFVYIYDTHKIGSRHFTFCRYTSSSVLYAAGIDDVALPMPRLAKLFRRLVSRRTPPGSWDDGWDKKGGERERRPRSFPELTKIRQIYVAVINKSFGRSVRSKGSWAKHNWKRSIDRRTHQSFSRPDSLEASLPWSAVGVF